MWMVAIGDSGTAFSLGVHNETFFFFLMNHNETCCVLFFCHAFANAVLEMNLLLWYGLGIMFVGRRNMQCISDCKRLVGDMLSDK